VILAKILARPAFWLVGWLINFTCPGHNEKRFYMARPPAVVYNQVKCARVHKNLTYQPNGKANKWRKCI